MGPMAKTNREEPALATKMSLRQTLILLFFAGGLLTVWRWQNSAPSPLTESISDVSAKHPEGP